MKSNMKNYKIFQLTIGLLVLGLLSVGCEENDELPDFQTVGTSTATLATISISNDEPDPGEEITITLYYVNMEEDPASQLQVLQKVGSADFSELTTMDESSAQVSSEITHTVNYTVPNVESGTAITFDMLLSSQKEFPQRERASLEVQ